MDKMAFRPVVKRVPLINGESYRRQTRVQQAITIGNSTFTPQISMTPTNRSLDAYFVSLHWLLSGDESELYNTFEVYRSDRIDWIEFLEVELTVTLEQKESLANIHVDLFRNALAEDQSIYLAATKEERAFLKFLGRDSLCMIVRYILDVFKLDHSTLITLWPEGTHRTNAEHKNLLKYYHSLGFTGAGQRTLSAPASRFLQHCHNLS